MEHPGWTISYKLTIICINSNIIKSNIKIKIIILHVSYNIVTYM